MKIKHLAMAVAIGLGAVSAAYAETSSAIRGSVQDAQGQVTANAQVEILHVPSNTRTVATTNQSGAFVSSGLRVGGPYTITITSDQGTIRYENIFLSLGEPFRLNAQLETAQASNIERIAVTGTVGNLLNMGKMGAGSVFSSADIESAPLFDRDLKDVVRQDPLVVVLGDNDSSMSVAGANPRYNSLTVDGVRQDDDFGLNGNGYPTRRSPIPISAVDQIVVNTSPYNAKFGGFTGAGINAVTKSGTNEFSGSLFYEYMGDELSGKSGRSGQPKTDLGEFERKVWGLSAGGAIVQDTFFAFVAYEKLEEPSTLLWGPAGVATPNNASVTVADLDRVLNIARSVYGVEPGTWEYNPPEKDEKLLVKLDWNINDDHRASLTYQNTKSNGVAPGFASSSGRITMDSTAYDNKQNLESLAAHLYSNWTDNFSTDIKVAWKDVNTNQDPLRGREVGQVEVRTPSGSVVFGADSFRHVNVLTNELLQFRFAGEYLLEDHTITFGWDRETLDVFNAFVPYTLGQWTFNSIENFENRFVNSLRYENAFSGNSDDAAAAFKFTTDSLFLQNSWELFEYDLTLDFGLRYERYSSSDKPVVNQNFLERYGFDNTENLDGKSLLMPRIGFNWRATPEATVRGGVGRFGGGRPNVWVANSFSVDGVTKVRAPGNVSSNIENVDIKVIPTQVANSLQPGNGDVNAIDPNFKLPSEWKANLAVDYVLNLDGLGRWDLTAEYLHSYKDRDVIWKDLYREQFPITVGPDGRNIYSVPDNRHDILFINGKGGRSNVYALGASTKIDKLNMRFGYAHQNVKDVSSGTSSQAASNFARYPAVDRNIPQAGTAGYQIEHRLNMTLTYSHEFFAGYNSKFTVYAERRSGRPYSWTTGPGSTFGDVGSLGGGDDRNGYLVYVPSGPNDPAVRYEGEFGWNNFVAAGLDKYAGTIVPRNTESGRWTSTVDFKFEQEIPGFAVGHKGSVYFEVKNLLNLIDSSAGRVYETAFPGYQRIANVAYDAAANQYVYSAPTARTGVPEAFRNVESAWRLKVGVSYKF